MPPRIVVGNRERIFLALTAAFLLNRAKIGNGTKNNFKLFSNGSATFLSLEYCFSTVKVAMYYLN